MVVTLTISCLFALTLTFLGVKFVEANPSVKVGLRSSWPAPPLLVELIESIALENPDTFFPFLDTLTKSDTFRSLTSLSPAEIYNRTLQIATSEGYLSGPGELAAVELHLALHSATPKIEAFYQHYIDIEGANSRPATNQSNDCQSWVDWYGETACDVQTLARLANIENPGAINASHLSSPQPKVLTFDHIYPSPSRTLERPLRTAILYASLSSPNFRDLHDYLRSLVDHPDSPVEYVFRHIPPTVRNNSYPNYLSGYGVSLDLKKMDYLALDDRSSGHQGPNEKLSSENEIGTIELDPISPLLKAYSENATAHDAATPLTESELLEIGFQSAQLILDSVEPLRTLTHVSQNFPKYATAIARRVVVNENLTAEVYENHFKVQPGTNMLWLNGVQIAEKDINPFNLLRLLRKERTLMLSLTSLGLTRTQAVELLTHPTVAAQSEKSIVDGVFDASDRPEDGGVIVWWNDIEKDRRYSQWSTSIYGLLQPLYPGQLPNVRLNWLNVILVLDLSRASGLNFITGAVSNFIERNLPIRFGLVPIAITKDGTHMARLFCYLVENYGRAKTMGVLKSISQTLQSTHTSTIDWAIVRFTVDEFLTTESPSESGTAINLESILGSSHDGWTVTLDKIHHYAERLGVTFANSQTGLAFVNGKHFELDDLFLRNMQIEIAQQVRYVQEKVHDGTITQEDATRISKYFYDLPTTNSHRNQYIHLPSTSGGLRIFNLLDLFSRALFHISANSFVYPSQSETIPLSLFVVADLDSDLGFDLIKEALGSIDASSQTRVAFIHNPTQLSNHGTAERIRPSRIISYLISKSLLPQASPAQILRALGSDLPVAFDNHNQEDHQTILQQLAGGVPLGEFDEATYTHYVKSSRLVARELQLKPGDRALVVNGRLVGPLHQNDSWGSSDFHVLEAYELRKRVTPVMQALNAVAAGYNRDSFSHLISMSSSIMWSIQLPDPSESGLFDAPPKPRQRNYQLLASNYTSFECGDSSTAMYHFAVLLDPLSEAAQKWSSLVEWLLSTPDVFTEFHLNPRRLSEVPLKRFYHYNLRPSLSFDDDGQECPAQTLFRDLPIEPIYTLAMDVPPSWLVRPREALYDLDNIQLGSLSPEDSGVEALFALDYLVVEGHARDTVTQSPPRGVQLQLATNGVPIDDTQVVANLGYLQFKAKPGVFQLEIRPGRGRDIFHMESVGNEGWDSPSVEAAGNEITLTSFEGLTLYPRLRRFPGMETADPLDEVANHVYQRSYNFFGSIMSRVKLLFGYQETVNSDILPGMNDQADINIFTVASGLLYERFVSIMILSVLRNTNSTVKFWFIENFLSPSFLEFIPHLAQAYHFKYELVTYKWPSWLRDQKEKQRIIWAYKILFLDVLFPMDLKKVIFVDADQIVRADLKELVDLDLQGAPYGYTPMGDDNPDMEGFRFWKTGYWKDFLRGRPYHISALYVIDLVRFRQIAAGDILRGHYQALSQDPNSLANLDQDLPNNLQREVPIFSLHQDWLWCETWCSKDRLHLAKTIDLCQNPLTKEPKLSRARKIPEWEEYDREIARFARTLADQGLIRSHIVAADANLLANAITTTQTDPAPIDGSVEETEPPTQPKDIRDEL